MNEAETRAGHIDPADCRRLGRGRRQRSAARIPHHQGAVAGRLSPLLKLRYNNAIADALKDLGNPEQIRQVFVGFQRFLYQS